MTYARQGTPQTYARHSGENSRRVQIEGVAAAALKKSQARLTAVAGIFAIGFLVLAGRVVDLTLVRIPELFAAPPVVTALAFRPDITDRNGILLATSLKGVSLYANPRDIPNPKQAARHLAAIIPGLDQAATVARLSSEKSFVWLERHLGPRQQDAINRLGIPGLNFEPTVKRIYPQGRHAAHVIGYVGIDSEGLGGIEKTLDYEGRQDETRAQVLSIDLRVQNALREELIWAVAEFRAIGAAGVVMDVATGEILALVSLPDFDPNRIDQSINDQRFNRATLAVYEMGSTFKTFTTANALEIGTVNLKSGYDASEPIRVARFIIRDDHAKNRWLSVPEILVYSSNIGAAKMALDIGSERQRKFLGDLGLLRAAEIELPEVGSPLSPTPWREINTMTIAFGHGVAVSPVQLANAFATIINGGVHHVPTLFKRVPGARTPGKRVLSEHVSADMRHLLRRIVVEGTGKKAAAPGYVVGGKTGTAEKAKAGGYNRKALIASFVGAFPMNDPRYVVLALLDEPKGNESTFNFASAGWTAAPTVGRIISRIAPILAVKPIDEDDRQLMAAAWTP